MKKVIVTLFCALVMAGAASGQGTVSWSFISPVAMTAQTNSTQYSPLQGGGATGSGSQGAMASASTGTLFYFALLFNSFAGTQLAQPNNLLALNSWQDTGLTATNSSIAGRLTPVAPTTHATISWDNGITNSIMMVGWSANLGSSWLAVSSVLNNWGTSAGSIVGPAYFSTSTTGYITPNSTGTDPGANLFGISPTSSGLPINSVNTSLYGLDAFTPFIVPEPSALAVTGLGGLLLVTLRRRR